MKLGIFSLLLHVWLVRMGIDPFLMSLISLLLSAELLVIVNKTPLDGLIRVKTVLLVMCTNIPIINYILTSVYRIVRVIAMLGMLKIAIYAKRATF